jgi:hypothetical protein
MIYMLKLVRIPQDLTSEIVQVGGGFPPTWVAMGVYEGAVALGVGAAIGGVAGKLYKKYFA